MSPVPIPKFNAYGLLPPGFHPVTMQEIERALSFSAKRRSLIEDGLKPVVRELEQAGTPTLYLGGSFTTDKVSPNDVDGYVVARVASEICRRVIERQEFWKAQHQADINLAAEDVAGDLASWEDWFGHTKEEPRRERGILKLALRRG